MSDKDGASEVLVGSPMPEPDIEELMKEIRKNSRVENVIFNSKLFSLTTNKLGIMVNTMAIIQSVEEGSPANIAGLRVGDIILGIEGLSEGLPKINWSKFPNLEEIAKYKQRDKRTRINNILRFTTIKIQDVIEGFPIVEINPDMIDDVYIRPPSDLIQVFKEKSTGRITTTSEIVIDSDFDINKGFGMTINYINMIMYIKPESAAEKGGLRVGDIILRLNGNNVKNPYMSLIDIPLENRIAFKVSNFTDTLQEFFGSPVPIGMLLPPTDSTQTKKIYPDLALASAPASTMEETKMSAEEPPPKYSMVTRKKDDSEETGGSIKRKSKAMRKSKKIKKSKAMRKSNKRKRSRKQRKTRKSKAMKKYKRR